MNDTINQLIVTSVTNPALMLCELCAKRVWRVVRVPMIWAVALSGRKRMLVLA